MVEGRWSKNHDDDFRRSNTDGVTAQDVLKTVLATELRDKFAAHGFKKRAQSFSRRTGENFSIIQFQKSQSSDALSLTFTINLGVFSARLYRALEPIVESPDLIGLPKESDCHLRRRCPRSRIT